MSNDRPLNPSELRAWLEETKRDTVFVVPPEVPSEEAETEKQPIPQPPTPVVSRRAKAPTPPTDIKIGEAHAMDKQLAKRFTRGTLPLDGTLDLHGMHLEPAHDAVIDFIVSRHECGARHLCIVTGKGTRGGGVLRDSLEGWLNVPSVRARIIAAVYGKPHKGGEGAVYVLLKRHGRARPTK